ncbi:MAG TPA: hypothetical protein VFM54_22710, partial [Micromonosporaceae bacterium]|nr:hypothetical protein [Micromonosporaceae bacterium]
ASAPAGRPEPDGCPAALAATVDGGLTWQSRQHPRPVAPGQQLYVGGARLVLLHADPYGWYVSTDAGLTFAFRPGSAPPPEYATVAGRYGVWCEPAPCRVVEGYPPGGGRRPVPAQPDLPGELVTVAQAGAHELWAVSVAQGRAYPAVSLDQGRSWQRRDLPGPVGGSSGSPDGRPVSRVELRVSPDGRDVWLLGFGPAARLEFPRLWLHGPGGWRVRHAGDPAPVAHAFAAAGGQALVVAGPGGLGVVGDGYATFGDWPSATGYVRALPDGALVAAADTTGTDTTGTGERLWLGVGRGTDRRWIEVIVRTS